MTLQSSNQSFSYIFARSLNWLPLFKGNQKVILTLEILGLYSAGKLPGQVSGLLCVRRES